MLSVLGAFPTAVKDFLAAVVLFPALTALMVGYGYMSGQRRFSLSSEAEA